VQFFTLAVRFERDRIAPMKTLVRATTVLGFAGATFVTSYASAHIRFVYPTPRYPTPMGMDDSSNIKDPPCGRAMNDARTTDTSRITVLEPGATIEVEWNETINHPGHYRIAFDDDGQDAFVTPLARADVQTGPTFTLPVLLDNIADKAGGSYTAMVTLPNVECERCTLQLIQVMVTGMTWPVDEIYFTCADIALRRSGGGGGMGGMSGSGGSPSGGSGGASAGAGGAIGPGGAGAGGMATGGSGGASGGVAPTGGVSTGGALTGGTGGTTATGGAPTGGVPAGGAPAAGTGPAPVEPNAPPEDTGGCRFAPAHSGGGALTAAALALLGMLVRRRRGLRSSAV
jgi:uncharacterized membrane protein YgcG